ncbi:MAG: hypothetical protein J6I68_14535 [Butyrivibrio sp.]|uniref:hypothetical protein n=1 Tax=Butyrivibrio sp. TaxID=28121 RepID=UPI001B4D4088|nr:hypothetical protein [Butyrivibrio sp.]MBP3784459.1 hypothetical protein [Butyrivibrio sp.]
MRRSYSSELEKIKSKNNRQSMQLMSEEAVLAKESGISYGYLQAGLGPDFEESEYPVSSVSYITKTEAEDHKKVLAFIR